MNNYDLFEPFLEVPGSEFLFEPKRYEIWEKGNMIKGGAISGHIKGEPAIISSEVKLEVTLAVLGLDGFIFPSFIFDIFFSQRDRIQLASIPPEGPTDSNGMVSLRSVTGITTNSNRKFNTEPYCAGLFFQNKRLVQVSFSFNSPIRLIEFYGAGITTMNLRIPANKG